MIQQLQSQHADKDFFKLTKIFQHDSIFEKFTQAMSENQTYFIGLKVCDAVEEITWWLYHTNVSCMESGLVSEKDVKAFALFIITDFTYWKKNKTEIPFL